MTKTILFVVADEFRFQGFADYMKAMALELEKDGSDEYEYRFVKVPFKDNPAALNAADIALPPGKELPVSNEIYERIPFYNSQEDYFSDGNIAHICAVGEASLRTTVEDLLLKAKAAANGVSASYITHQVKSANELRMVADNQVLLFAPHTQDELIGLDKVAGSNANLWKISGAPHTATVDGCAMHHAEYIATEKGAGVYDLVKANPFVIQVVNAGISMPNETYLPYTAQEARVHGEKLAINFLQHRVEPVFVLTHGGPRNLQDEERGEYTMDAFAAGVKGVFPRTHIVQERFQKGLPYNMINVGYHWARNLDTCYAFMSNAEGNGTMKALTELADSITVNLGMFPFEALHRDPTGKRMRTVEGFRQKGIDVWEVKNGVLRIDRAPSSAVTPLPMDNPGREILLNLGLLKPERAPQPRSEEKLTP